MKTTFTFMILIAFSAVLVSGIRLTAGRPAEQSYHFTSLGDLPGGIFDSFAYDVSADGSVVVGGSNSHSGLEAFRWTSRTGMVGLGFPSALAVSDDGSAVVGYRWIKGGAEAVRWSGHGRIQCIGTIPGADVADARGISTDGSVIVGECGPLYSMRKSLGFRWTEATGMTPLESPSGTIATSAYDVSADGNVVVGVLRDASGGRKAFRWTKQDGFAALGVLPGDADSIAHAVSGDGSVVVGVSETMIGSQAFRWTEQTEMAGLGTLPGGARHSRALGVSADGSVIVGQCNGDSGLEAFIWDAAHGMRSIRKILIDDFGLGRCLRGWKLYSARAVSHDGSVVVGFGINPEGNREAWIARLGKESPASNRYATSHLASHASVASQWARH